MSESIRNAFGNTGVDVVAMGMSGSYALPGQDEDVRDLVTIGFIRGVEDQASLATGEWPAPTREDGPIAVAVLEPVAELLGLGVGDTLGSRAERTPIGPSTSRSAAPTSRRNLGIVSGGTTSAC